MAVPVPPLPPDQAFETLQHLLTREGIPVAPLERDDGCIVYASPRHRLDDAHQAQIRVVRLLPFVKTVRALEFVIIETRDGAECVVYCASLIHFTSRPDAWLLAVDNERETDGGEPTPSDVGPQTYDGRKPTLDGPCARLPDVQRNVERLASFYRRLPPAPRPPDAP